MSHYQEMLDVALRDFDDRVAATMKQWRQLLRQSGWSKRDINKEIERCRPGLAEQRAGIPAMVQVEFLRVGVPIQKEVRA